MKQLLHRIRGRKLLRAINEAREEIIRSNGAEKDFQKFKRLFSELGAFEMSPIREVPNSQLYLHAKLERDIKQAIKRELVEDLREEGWID